MKAPVLISFSVMLCGSSLFGIERPKSLDSDKPRVPAEQVDNGIKEGGAEGAQHDDRAAAGAAPRR